MTLNLTNFKFLFLTFLILATSVTTLQASDETAIPIGESPIKKYLETYFQPSIVLNSLYLTDKVDAGRQQKTPVTRKQLEAGSVAVFRYGNRKATGGYFNKAAWAPNEIERIISEYIEDGGLDPFIPDEDLEPEERALKKELIAEAREEVGYTLGEQRRFVATALIEKKKELGRDLTEDEKNALRQTILKQFPQSHDPQTDESEGIAVVNNTNIYEIYNVFRQRDRYMELMPKYFLYSYVLKQRDLEPRGISLGSHEDILFGLFKIADYQFEYSALNEGKQYFREVSLNTAEGIVKKAIPGINAAWRISPRLNEDGRFKPIYDEATKKIIGNNGKFGHRDILVSDGYLQLEPYIAKDDQGFESIDESRVVAVYHTYMRIDPYYADLTGLTNFFREAESRKFMEAMINIFR